MTRWSLVGRLLAFGRPLLVWLGASTIFRVAGMGCGIALLGVGVYGVTGDEPLGRLLAIMVALALAKGLFRYLEQYTGHYVAFRLLAMLRNDFYSKVEPLAPAGLMARDHSGDLLTRAMKDIGRIEVFYAHVIAPTISALVLPAVVVAILGTVYHPAFAWVAAPFLLAVGFVVPALSHASSASAASDLLGARGRVAAHLVDGIQGLREILTFGHGERRASELANLGTDVGSARVRLARSGALRRGLNEALVGAALVIQLVVGANLVADGLVSWSALAVVLAITAAAFPSVLAIEEFVGDLEQAFSSARRLFEISDRLPSVVDPPTPLAAAPKNASIRFENVSFSYSETPVLRNVSFVVPAGEQVALVGASGAGKSTVVSLLLRFWDSDQGRILIGGVDLRTMSLSNLRERIAVVSQRTHLFNESVGDNLRIARPNATQAEIESACRRAAIHDFVVSLPAGYDTVIGEMGEKLSGGQRQRLAIARALLKDAPILILDEATSELDTETEREIQDQIDALAEGRTVLVIAHRRAPVEGVDKIIVLDRGQVLAV